VAVVVIVKGAVIIAHDYISVAASIIVADVIINDVINFYDLVITDDVIVIIK
jgi:hypothetical protein